MSDRGCMKNSHLDTDVFKKLRDQRNQSSEGCHPTCISSWLDRLIIQFAVLMGDKYDLVVTGSGLILVTQFFPKH